MARSCAYPLVREKVLVGFREKVLDTPVLTFGTDVNLPLTFGTRVPERCDKKIKDPKRCVVKVTKDLTYFCGCEEDYERKMRRD